MRTAFVCAIVAGALGLGACGESETDKSFRSADAQQAVFDITNECASGNADESKLSSSVDDLLDLYDESGDDAEVKSALRDAAGALRGCSDSLADRLNGATD